MNNFNWSALGIFWLVMFGIFLAIAYVLFMIDLICRPYAYEKAKIVTLILHIIAVIAFSIWLGFAL